MAGRVNLSDAHTPREQQIARRNQAKHKLQLSLDNCEVNQTKPPNCYNIIKYANYY